MFKKMLDFIRALLRQTFGEDSAPGAVSISSQMENSIGLWADMYDRGGPWTSGKDGLHSLGLPAAIAGEFARLTVAEARFSFSPEGTRAAAMLDWTSALFSRLRAQVEYGCALGGLVIKPYNNGDGIVFDVIHGDRFIPLSFDGTGRMTGAVFLDQIHRGKYIYTRFERHELGPGGYKIENRAYASTNDVHIGREIPLTDVPEWADLAPDATLQNVSRPLFGHFRVPFANQVDRTSPLGVSVYSRAVELIRDADEQYGRFLWEFEGGELAIDAAEDYLQDAADGHTRMPKGKKRLFRALGAADANFYQVFSPQLRDESQRRGLNEILRRIEFNCALAYGTISNPETVNKTAEEIRTSRQRSYVAASDVQKALETALCDAVDAAGVLADLYGLAPGNCRIACTWGDSVLEDSEKEFSRRMQLVSSGLLKDELMLGWYFGEPCETPVEQQAIREKYMPEMEKLLRDTE